MRAREERRVEGNVYGMYNFLVYYDHFLFTSPLLSFHLSIQTYGKEEQ
jgi:hypothetical protein